MSAVNLLFYFTCTRRHVDILGNTVISDKLPGCWLRVQSGVVGTVCLLDTKTRG